MARSAKDSEEARIVAALEFATTAGARLAPAPEARKGAGKLAASWRGWRIGANVVGMGVARKIVSGSPTPELALKIYVARKLPLRRLAAGARVPARVRLPHVEGEITTDVEEIGRMRLEALTARVRPAIPGYSIAHREVTAGTFGAVVRDRGAGKAGAAGKALYILSNSHVLANSGLGRRGDAVLQPGPADGGGRGDRIAALDRWHPFDFGGDFVNVADVALAGPVAPDLVTPEIASIGIPLGVTGALERGMKVQKTGRTTGYTVGEVKDIHYRTALVYPKPGGGEGRVLYRDQVLCTRHTEPGDSGSLVLDMEKRAVGLHFAGSPGASVFSPIGPALELVDAELVTGETRAQAATAGGARADRDRARVRRDCRAALEAHAARLFEIPGVVGAGVGEKQIGGTPTGHQAVIVYVVEKKPKRRLGPGEMIPSELSVPGSRGTGGAGVESVPTDVVETGPMQLERG